MVPGGESVQQLPGFEAVVEQRVVEPEFEREDVSVSVGKDSTVDQELTEVLRRLAPCGAVEGSVIKGECSCGESAEESLEVGVAQPDGGASGVALVAESIPEGQQFGSNGACPIVQDHL
jgi:hypothetical protein